MPRPQRPQRTAQSSSRARRATCGLALLILAACDPLEAAAPRLLELRLIRPANPEGVFLNEELVFFFSDDVDRASVTQASVRIESAEDEGGGRESARGSLQIDGERVRFVPAPALRADLGDGGYLPGRRYTVTLAGFPRPDCLRSVGGAPLARSWTWSFRTVQVDTPRSGLIFDDRMQDKFAVLRLCPAPPGLHDQRYILGTQDSLYLACDKPLDPSSIHDDDFTLVSPSRPGERIALRARLVENFTDAAPRPRRPGVRSSAPAELWERERRAALIELTPRQRLESAEYQLQVLAGTRADDYCLRDYGGRAVWEPGRPLRPIRVVDRLDERTQGELHEAFLDRRLRSPVAPPDCDGTAHWDAAGRIEVRFPAAAGTGRDGAQALGPAESRSDVHATELALAEDVTCTLAAASGPVVLRSQRRMTIEGKLLRQAIEPAALAVDPEHESGLSLSEWLARVQEGRALWTVLIAGGDLVITGELRVSTPLLLCAGGVIRITGAVHGVKGQVYLLGDGGGLRIDPPAQSARLEIDAPLVNPLVEGLRLAVLSSPIPPVGSVARWLSAEVGGSREGASSGRWRVRYLPEAAVSGAGAETWLPVDRPSLLEKAGSMQFLIELEVDAVRASVPDRLERQPWNPPFVDFVRVSWEQPSSNPAGQGR